jgi:ribosomal protein S2
MDEPYPADELTNLRKLLDRLETGYTIMRHNGADVTKREIALLRKEIARLEKILARLKADA